MLKQRSYNNSSIDLVVEEEDLVNEGHNMKFSFIQHTSSRRVSTRGGASCWCLLEV